MGVTILFWTPFVLAVGRLAGRALHLVKRSVTADSASAPGWVAARDSVATFEKRRTRALMRFHPGTGCSTSPPSSRRSPRGRACPAVPGADGLRRRTGARPDPAHAGRLGFVESGMTTLLVLNRVTPDQAVVALSSTGSSPSGYLIPSGRSPGRLAAQRPPVPTCTSGPPAALAVVSVRHRRPRSRGPSPSAARPPGRPSPWRSCGREPRHLGLLHVGEVIGAPSFLAPSVWASLSAVVAPPSPPHPGGGWEGGCGLLERLPAAVGVGTHPERPAAGPGPGRSRAAGRSHARRR